MHALASSSEKPSTGAHIFAPVARVWQSVQNSVAKVLGLKNAGYASGVVAAIGLTSMAVGGILAAPAAYAVGTTIATAGAVGIVENKVTSKVATWDGKGESV